MGTVPIFTIANTIPNGSFTLLDTETDTDTHNMSREPNGISNALCVWRV